MVRLIAAGGFLCVVLVASLLVWLVQSVGDDEVRTVRTHHDG